MSVFLTTIIPTIGRPSLGQAVESVLRQDFDRAGFEIIVVNDSGEPLQDEAWQRDPRVQVLTTQRRERSAARNAGAALAKGQYLHFLDDDDYMMPGALEQFWGASQHAPGAAWLYGSCQLADRKGRPRMILKHDLPANCFVQLMAGEWVPLQSSIVRAAVFFEVGGFNNSLVGPEDIDLARRVGLAGVFRAVRYVTASVAMGRQGSTTNWRTHQADSRRARDAILQGKGVYARLRAGADDPYWSGKIVRMYGVAALLRLRRGDVTMLISRAGMGVRALFAAGRHVFSPQFWYAVTHRHESEAFGGNVLPG